MEEPTPPDPRGRWIRVVDGRAPLLFSGPFWCAVVLVLASAAADLNLVDVGTPQRMQPTTAPMLVGALLAAAIWPMLRWTPTAPAWRKVLSAVFAALICLMLLVGGWASVVLMALVVVHVVFVFGNRGAIVYGFVMLAVAFGISLYFRNSLTVALVESAVTGVFAAWAIAMANVLSSEQRHARRTRELLAEQARAHADLRRYADRVRELTVGEERARMSREMHDSVGHYLTVIALGLRNAERYRAAGRDGAWEEVAQARQLTAEALADTRRWVRALRPLALEGRAGIDALAALAGSFDGDGLTVDFAAHTGVDEVGEDAELVLYRVLQEGLTNVVRHSGARRVTIRLDRSVLGVVLTIRDDGRGRGDDVSDGLGIDGLRHRVAVLGGTITTTGDTGGFTLRAELPAPVPARVG
ncbi:signal transduction histidine kinase [Stackebrandtia albiflava]|uniref:histidine kinase n=1 Tax=Stackebrandtia albiflava TaxID=406432 RepID=A0A562UQQ1_9ACTN|nr:histidine kinase [Stackebrandtia albiflava]TWJ07940.1 signal transduction histidine kinase [Stackebrandtia albiflava]